MMSGAGDESTTFMGRYIDLCKNSKTRPSPEIKVHGRDLALDFRSDRIKTREWMPLLSAIAGDNTLKSLRITSRQLAPKYLQEVRKKDELSKAKELPVIYTRYMVGQLASCLAKRLALDVLKVLELFKLTLSEETAKILSKGLRCNSSLEKLSLVHCPIGDGGCCNICDALKDRMNLVHLEFTDCSLTHKGAKHISELIKCQKLSRFEETWRNSLRYREVDSNQLAGLRRLTVNNNKDIGDAGFKEIVDVLYDDLWLKAIDMQACGLSDKCVEPLLDLMAMNTSLVIFDVWNNFITDVETFQEVSKKLVKNMDNDPLSFEYLRIATGAPPQSSYENSITDTSHSGRSNTPERRENSEAIPVQNPPVISVKVPMENDTSLELSENDLETNEIPISSELPRKDTIGSAIPACNPEERSVAANRLGIPISRNPELFRDFFRPKEKVFSDPPGQTEIEPDIPARDMREESSKNARDNGLRRSCDEGEPKQPGENPETVTNGTRRAPFEIDKRDFEKFLDKDRQSVNPQNDTTKRTRVKEPDRSCPTEKVHPSRGKRENYTGKSNSFHSGNGPTLKTTFSVNESVESDATNERISEDLAHSVDALFGVSWTAGQGRRGRGSTPRRRRDASIHLIFSESQGRRSGGDPHLAEFIGSLFGEEFAENL